METPTPTEILWLTEQTGCLPLRLHVGVLRQGGDCLLVDSGIDRSAGNRIAAAIGAAGLTAKGLLITHSHADHCGGNAALHAKLGLTVFAPPLECAVLRQPELEPMVLYGAAPPAALGSKFFLATPTPAVAPLEPGMQAVGGVPFTAVPLHGHCPQQYGYLSQDGVLFCGDALFPAYVWEKYGLPYFFDVDGALAAFDAIEALVPTLTACVTAHNGPVDDVAALVQANRQGLRAAADWLATCLRQQPQSREDALAAAFTSFGLEQNEAQYYLVGSTIAALLTHLVKAGRAAAQVENGRLRYHAL